MNESEREITKEKGQAKPTRSYHLGIKRPLMDSDDSENKSQLVSGESRRDGGISGQEGG